jgi:hypothetical protein
MSVCGVNQHDAFRVALACPNGPAPLATSTFTADGWVKPRRASIPDAGEVLANKEPPSLTSLALLFRKVLEWPPR